MNGKIRKSLIYLLSAAAVIWAVYNYPGFEKQPENRQSDSVQTIGKTNVKHAVDSRIDIEALSDEPWGEDPFRDYLRSRTDTIGRKINSVRWSLSGILYSKDIPLAFVNGRSVRVGDIVDQARVIAIQRKAVILDHKGKQITLSVGRG
jgi:hypothetical protein